MNPDEKKELAINEYYVHLEETYVVTLTIRVQANSFAEAVRNVGENEGEEVGREAKENFTSDPSTWRVEAL